MPEVARQPDTPGHRLKAPVSPLAPHTATPDELRERMEATRSGSPFVLLRSSDDRQILVSLQSRTRVSIGRRPECDVAVPWDGRVSRLHAELVQIGNDWVVTDDGLSANGTWIGDHRLSGRHRLRDGSLIRVGDTLIAFCAPRENQTVTVMTENPSRLITISPAQRRVLVALCQPFLTTGGLSPPTNPELAENLFLSVESIKTHLKALFEAFDLDDVPPRQKRAALVERAVRLGIVGSRDVQNG